MIFLVVFNTKEVCKGVLVPREATGSPKQAITQDVTWWVSNDVNPGPYILGGYSNAMKRLLFPPVLRFSPVQHLEHCNFSYSKGNSLKRFLGLIQRGEVKKLLKCQLFSICKSIFFSALALTPRLRHACDTERVLLYLPSQFCLGL